MSQIGDRWSPELLELQPPVTNAAQNLRANVAEFSVGELANAIKRALEDGFGFVRLRGRFRAIAARTRPVTAISR